MPSELVINATLPEIRVALLEDGEISDLSIEYEKNKSIVGNVYKGRIVRVLPGMQAAFVDIGLERAAFLYVGDIVYDADEDEEEEEVAAPAPAREQSRDASREQSSEQNGEGADAEEEGNESLDFETSDIIAEKNIGHLEEGGEKPAEGSEEGLDEEALDGEDDAGPSHRMAAQPDRSRQHSRHKRGGRSKPRSSRPRLNIQDVVKEGQDVVVQVAKEPMGTKGARLTCHISLPGRHVVLMPTVDHVGVSRKIASSEERRRLRGIVDELRPAGMGIIVRTVAAEQSNEQLTNEIKYLLNSWDSVKKKTETQKAPYCLNEDLNVVLKTVRDYFTDDIHRLVVDSPRVFSYVVEFAEQFAPHLVNRVVKYTGKDPIFDAYGIESEITRALNRKVWLKSGGYLIVDQTEALTVIDVNTGKFIGKKNLEETILKTNMEAVKEVAYQLRLRNVGGIIIIDLIDMEKSSHREKVYRALEDALKKDKSKTNILRISELGLIQMTRKRTRESLNHVLCEACPYCNGKGFTKNLRTVCYDIFRELERAALEGGTVGARVVAHPEVVDTLFQDERETLHKLEERFGMKVSIQGDQTLHIEDFKVEGEKLSLSSRKAPEAAKPVVKPAVVAEAEAATTLETAVNSVEANIATPSKGESTGPVIAAEPDSAEETGSASDQDVAEENEGKDDSEEAPKL
ncbi:MAG: Rne/Rng family ribonuclease [Proteobacteria bacterium]|nr:MAG: Rne/Rng family ribonuclease [Pseudomonadota bacterium]